MEACPPPKIFKKDFDLRWIYHCILLPYLFMYKTHDFSRFFCTKVRVACYTSELYD